MTAEVVETTTFVPENPEDLASVARFLSAHERYRMIEAADLIRAVT
jgi:hypothetical protein